MLNAPSAGITDDRPADLQIGGLHIWIHGWQFPHLHDSDDGNWLDVTAECRYPSSRVIVRGPIIHVPEIKTLMKGCKAMHKSLKGSAALACMEPHLAARLVITDGAGHIELTIEITPDLVSEKHKYSEEIDQTFLPPIIDQCTEILRLYPVRGGLFG